MTEPDDRKARLSTFLAARLGEESAKEEWRRNLEASFASLRGARVSDVLPRGAVAAALAVVNRPQVFTALVSPLALAFEREVLPRLREQRAALGAFVPEAGRQKIDALLARPSPVSPELVREVLAQEAMEEVMRDVLYDALHAFNSKVNPFFADWGIPGIVKKIMPIGSGAVLKSLDSVRAEFDKRLEPEIRKFLAGFSRKALDRVGGFMVTRGDEPQFIELRRAVARWLYTQSLAELTAGVDDETVKLGREASILIAAQVASSGELARDIDSWLTGFYAKYGDRTVAEALQDHGITYIPDWDSLSEALWPLVKQIATSEPVISWVSGLIAEFLSAEAAGGS